jgi:hypothetical protein
MAVPLRPTLALVGVAFLLGILGGGCSPDGPSSPNTAPPASVLDSLPAAPAAPRGEGPPTKQVRGQTLYVPAYSHIYVRDARRTMNLATTLSIRNASPEHPITLTSLEYYDSNGTPVRSYTDTTRTLGAFASTYVVVEQDDVRGGVGANFLVRWRADAPVHPPIVETVMITSEATLGISFRSTARVLYEIPAAE